MDESGFSLSPPIRGTWAPRGKNPLLHYSFKRKHLSVIAALGISAWRKQWSVWCLVYEEALTAGHVQAFLSHLLRKIPGTLILLWDRGPIHKEATLRHFLERHPRMKTFELPGYAPELNPVEFLWSLLKTKLSHFAARDLDELYERFQMVWKDVAKSKRLLKSFIQATPLKHP